MDAERAARQIVGAVRERRAEIILTRPDASPAGASPADGEGTPGQDLDPAIPRKAFGRLTALGRAAAGRFNERR
jgi:hypothetical protein